MYLAVLIRTRSFYRHLIGQLGGVSGGGGRGGNLLPQLMLSKYKGCLQNEKFCMNPHTPSSEIRITSTTELPNGNKL